VRTAAALALAVALAASGCSPAWRGRRQTPCGPVPPGPAPEEATGAPADRPFHEGTPIERAKVEALLARIPAASADERLEIGRSIVRAGAPAVPVLVASLRHRDPVLRGEAAYLLGVVKDRRTVPMLVDAASDPVARVRYEAAGALLELGDERGFPALVQGLVDPDARLRAKCAAVLEQKTGQRFGYAADDPPEERARVVRAWKSWLEMRRAEAAALSEGR
jgi:HEAT repeat protein